MLALITALGLALRVAAAWVQKPIADEFFSYFGAQVVAERGIPLLPSGVLYLHGTLHSYLTAPLFALGLGDPDNLGALRLLSALTGAVAIVLTFRLARVAGALNGTALFAAALVAVDPASVHWGGYVRMYALAQVLAIAVALFFLPAISAESRFAAPGPTRRRTLAGLVITFWLAVFTHLSTALLLPAMVAVAVVLYGPDLLRGRRDLTLAFAGCLLAPLLLVGLTGAIGPGAGTALSGRSEGLPGISFLGEDNVNLSQVLQPDPSSWTALFAVGPLSLLLPLLLALASGLLIGRLLTADGGGAAFQPRLTGALLALYWLPILVLALFTTDAAERYAVYLLPTGYVLLALAAEMLIAPLQGRSFAGWATAGGVLLAAAVLLHGAVGATRVGPNETAAGEAAAIPAEEYILAHRQPGELILTSEAVASALRMGRLPELRFLPGGEGSQRARRYTRVSDDGQAIDYWLGMPSLSTTAALCDTLDSAPGSWLLLRKRVWENWGYNDQPPRAMARLSAEMRDLVSGLADQVYEDEERIVLRSRPQSGWDQLAVAACTEGDLQRGERQRRSPDEASDKP